MSRSPSTCVPPPLFFNPFVTPSSPPLSSNIQGAPTYAGAHKVASTISTSSLVKTALHGEDANWGRILCAVGYSDPDFTIDPSLVSVSFIPTDGSPELRLLVNGEPEQVDEKRASEILKAEDLEVRIELGLGKESATYWTCDLSHEYIAINAGQFFFSLFWLFLCPPKGLTLRNGLQITGHERREEVRLLRSAGTL